MPRRLSACRPGASELSVLLDKGVTRKLDRPTRAPRTPPTTNSIQQNGNQQHHLPVRQHYRRRRAVPACCAIITTPRTSNQRRHYSLLKTRASTTAELLPAGRGTPATLADGTYIRQGELLRNQPRPIPRPRPASAWRSFKASIRRAPNDHERDRTTPTASTPTTTIAKLELGLKSITDYLGQYDLRHQS